MNYRIATYQHPTHTEKAIAILTDETEAEAIATSGIGWKLVETRDVDLPPVPNELTNRLLLSREAMGQIDLRTIRFWLGPVDAPDADDVDELAAEGMQGLMDARDRQLDEVPPDFDRLEPD
jgi:hypothetical protein